MFKSIYFLSSWNKTAQNRFISKQKLWILFNLRTTTLPCTKALTFYFSNSDEAPCNKFAEIRSGLCLYEIVMQSVNIINPNWNEVFIYFSFHSIWSDAVKFWNPKVNVSSKTFNIWLPQSNWIQSAVQLMANKKTELFPSLLINYSYFCKVARTFLCSEESLLQTIWFEYIAFEN